MLIISGAPALSGFRLEKLLAAVSARHDAWRAVLAPVEGAGDPASAAARVAPLLHETVQSLLATFYPGALERARDVPTESGSDAAPHGEAHDRVAPDRAA